MLKKILVVAAHPDDEVLGCGGAIARYAKEGNIIRVIILAEGITSRGGINNAINISELRQCAHAANKILGVSELMLYDFPDNRMDSVDRLEIIKKIEKELKVFRPDIVFTHWIGDVNIDHQLVHESVITACRPLPGFFVKKLFFFEIASSTEWQVTGTRPPFNPNCFIDITETLAVKIEALKKYTSEIRNFPHPRSAEGIEYLARWRGVCCGNQAAEAFIIGRECL